MIDLTPLDIRKKKGDFSKAMRGYEPREVNHFLDMVAERLEEVVKVNLTLRERVDRLTERVSGQEGRERAVQEALITAQSVKQDIQDQALREAELVKREAASSAEGTRREAETASQALMREAESYAAELRREVEVSSQALKRDAESLRRESESSAELIGEEIKRVLNERRREIMDLNRGRARFLKSFRSLLERELDGVEVAESNVPSEELDLDVLKFGRSSAKAEEAIAEAVDGANGDGPKEVHETPIVPRIDLLPRVPVALRAEENPVVGAISGPAAEVPAEVPAAGTEEAGGPADEERWGVR